MSRKKDLYRVNIKFFSDDPDVEKEVYSIASKYDRLTIGHISDHLAFSFDDLENAINFSSEALCLEYVKSSKLIKPNLI